jgi:hypothetical protein
MLLFVTGKVLNRILLQIMKDTVDTFLRDQQVGFRQNRSCADLIATSHIKVEQLSDWNSPAYINFIDYKNAFDGMDRETFGSFLHMKPVRIRVRIGPPHPLVCCKRRLNGDP